jgi:hypothetical protein
VNSQHTKNTNHKANKNKHDWNNIFQILDAIYQVLAEVRKENHQQLLPLGHVALKHGQMNRKTTSKLMVVKHRSKNPKRILKHFNSEHRRSNKPSRHSF